jgi:adenylate cyclase class 2
MLDCPLIRFSAACWRYKLPHMQAVETEVKIRLAHRATFEHGLSQLGFRRVNPRTFERNTLYDTPGRNLRNTRQILRIRQYGEKWVVTHKSVAQDEDPDQPYKRRVETETEVEDGPSLGKIFESLGFGPVFVYEKWRTEWADQQGHCVLDETPLGLYAELEGPSEWIDSTARRLGIDARQFIKLSYGRIFEIWREQTASSAQNLTFAEISQNLRQS